ncbi:hypothetical protein HDK90DRAFT_79362 [Phyllosticta capitalensis]|uniref:Uncharacterized protein n=1 Tax=Phyllosticta capitalensis TaxID=121624 RepID=A0ABR1YDQ9_9PEZI
MAAEQAQGKVEASVFAIITAFTSGLDVFRKLRERRGRRKKTRKAHCSRPHSTTALDLSDDELQLSNSLQRGPVEIQDRYQLNRRHAGEPFAQGDSIAHASLTEVLLKLNTGLVAIISSFLCHGKNESNLDYRSLAHLADCSRSEAVDALDQLYQRLSQSQMSLDRGRNGPCCPNCRSQKHADCGSVVDLKPVVAKKPSLVAVNAAAAAPPCASTKAPRQKSSRSQLVMVRPRKSSRLKTSSSTSAIPSGRLSATAGISPPRSPSPPPRPDATTTIAAAQRPLPPRQHKLSKKNALRSMTSLAAEPIPEHALPASPPLPLSLLPPPYPGLPPHANTARRTHRSSDNVRNEGPPKPPKIPLTRGQREENQRSLHRTPSSNLLPYSPYPATTTPPSSQRSRSHSHSRLRPQRHSSMPPIPLASVGPAAATTTSSTKSPPPQPLQQQQQQRQQPPQPQSQPQPHPHPQAQQPPAASISQHQNEPAAPHPSTLAQSQSQSQAQPLPHHPPPPRRRATLPAPPASIYSFTSDSTKLGEIPMSRWAGGPWDAERAARLNAAAGWGVSSPLAGDGGDVGGERRGSGGSGSAGGEAEREDGGERRKKEKDKDRGKGRSRLGARLWRWGSSGSGGSGSEKEREKEKKARA